MSYEQLQAPSSLTATTIQNSTYTYAEDAEASDSYAITLDPAITAYVAGQTFRFLANTANTGGATLNVNALGAKNILKQNDQALVTGDIEAGSIVTVTYDGTSFQMTSADANLGLEEITASATAKTTPVDADSVEMVDSEASNVHKTITWTNIKAFLVTYFDTLYQAILAEGAFVDGDKTKLDGIATGATANSKATISEINTGTDDTKFTTADGIAGSYAGTKGVVIVPFGSDEAVATGDGTLAFTVPSSLNGMNLVNVLASVYTKGVTGTTDIQVRRSRAGTDADMLSTKITLGDEWSVSDEVVDGTNDDVATGDQIYIDVDAVHSGTAPNGLSVALEFRLP